MYTTQLYDKDKMARARIPDRAISPKDAREISAALRGKPLEAGIALMRDVQAKRRPIRFTRYNQESAGHKHGTGPARYPVKAAAAFEELLGSVKANAEFKDLDAELLRITHVKADVAARPFRYGRHRGRQGKRAHLEVVVQEDDKLKASKKKEQDVTATKQKASSKKAPKKESKSDAKPEKKAESKSAEQGSKPETKSDAKPESKSAEKAEAKETKPAEPESKSETAEKPKAETKEEQPETKAAAPQSPAKESAPAAEKAPAKAESKIESKAETKPAEKQADEAPTKETKRAAEGGDEK